MRHFFALLWPPLAGFFFFSLNDALSKLAIERGLHPLQILFVSALLVVVVLLGAGRMLADHALVRARPALRTRLASLDLRSRFWRANLLRGALTVVLTLLFFYALMFYSLVQATLIFFLAPLWMFIFSALLLGERARPHQWFAVVLGFAGVAYALQPGRIELEWTLLLPVGASVAYAARAITIRSLRASERSLQIVLQTRLWVVLLTLAPALWVWRAPSATGWLLLVAIALVLIAGHGLVNRAIRTSSLALVGPLEYSAFVWAALLGYVIWGDRLSVEMIFGVALIVVSGLMVALPDASMLFRAFLRTTDKSR